jgi:peroxiredoxin
LFVALSATDYALIYSVQVPAFQRHVMIESREWKTRVGEQAPDITVVALDGSEARLSDFRGRTVLVNFFATWCGPCMHELPHLQAIWSDFKDRDKFTMLVIGRGETQETVAAFKSQSGYTLPLAIDVDSSAFQEFADSGIPRTYLISQDGGILNQSVGFGEMEVYQRELATLRRLVEKEL